MPSRRVNRDHPRSRGVYYAGKAEPRQRWGSSPLARGLRRGGRSGRSPAADHPRSRGVYAVTSPSPVIVAGSSPLARGLRNAAEITATPTGIIPARAGFTPSLSTTCPAPRDHPRSRGVYRRHCPHHPGLHGSSPLARGLPQPQDEWVRGRGIIPARAGFTQVSMPRQVGKTDHPRSRGVYYEDMRTKLQVEGSSPLARGLPHLGDELVHPPGIIPARAGFTSLPTDFSQGGADHPRSRGVYVRDRAKRFGLSGSSPLARGLLILLADLRRLARIIPARAGFTEVGLLGVSCRTDHPRSRGVYVRGHAHETPGRGIIPARAGFTT